MVELFIFVEHCLYVHVNKFSKIDYCSKASNLHKKYVKSDRHNNTLNPLVSNTIVKLKANPITPSVQKMVKHTLKILQQLLQGFEREFDHLVETSRYKFNGNVGANVHRSHSLF